MKKSGTSNGYLDFGTRYSTRAVKKQGPLLAAVNDRVGKVWQTSWIIRFCSSVRTAARAETKTELNLIQTEFVRSCLGR
jgi:hypothetical protein